MMKPESGMRDPAFGGAGSGADANPCDARPCRIRSPVPRHPFRPLQP